MVSQKTLAAFTALAMVIGSVASPCRPISSVITSATLSSVVTESTATATIDATSTSDFTSAATTYATDVTIIEIETTSTEAAMDTTTATEPTSTEIAITTTIASSTTEIASSTTAAEAPVETLLITNGGFETGNVAPWGSSGLAAVVNVVNSQSHGGSFSLAMGSQASDSIVMSQTLDKSLLVAMQPYKLSLYAKVSDGIKCSDGITMFVDNGSQQSPFGTSIVVPGNQLAADWAYVSGEFTFTEAALTGSGVVRVVFKTRCGNGYFAYVDDVKMELAN
ncbi:uncharacterized protein FTOL_07007 [Fusarium torulosum]|uniref:CBM-cenC domain-containing protein n=1 Tax=Fusarium torulosum TaxID=33205 RepID=A0AAE8MAH7_9HYPO|nr:uncharacterized protein FTOL_07007 [Fusarium torulosum]